ncbi:hypothetical protein [Variovorax soli]|uniref:hypothetical protein n=1 Tax=Variovorax soli TaxID=376815 RepID=UPI000837C018|nr:hypothetical protein [Variovorax soli]
MDLDAVPQEGNATLAGHRKLMYARAADGRVVGVTSAGWEAEEIVTLHAVDAIDAQADVALQLARQGLASPLEYWMHKRRMDVPLLAQTTGLWQWRVRRHLRPERFARLRAGLLARYAQALGLTETELRSLP